MQITIVQCAFEGMLDESRPPVALPGHLSKEECQKIAAEYGNLYPRMSFTDFRQEECKYEAAFYACYSNDEDVDPDGDEEEFEAVKGDLEVWFYHSTLGS